MSPWIIAGAVVGFLALVLAVVVIDNKRNYSGWFPYSRRPWWRRRGTFQAPDPFEPLSGADRDAWNSPD